MSAGGWPLFYHCYFCFPASRSGCLTDRFQEKILQIECSMEGQRLGAEYRPQKTETEERLSAGGGPLFYHCYVCFPASRSGSLTDRFSEKVLQIE